MLAALAIALLSVALGALLGFSRRAWALDAIQTFAVVSGLAVVLGHLLPEALAGAGVPALGAFVAAFAGALFLDKLAHTSEGGPSWGLELGFIGLCLHKLGDGLALGYYAGHLGPTADVLFAVAAHSVPVTALVVLAYLPRGPKVALVHAALLGLASASGVLLVGVVSPAVLEPASPWIAASTGGLLLHVVTHGWDGRSPQGLRHRLADLLAVVAGVGLVVVGHEAEAPSHSALEHHGGGDVRHETLEALVELGLETGPVLLIGLVLAAALQAFGGGLPRRWLQGGSRLGQALRGAIVGTPLPICSCGVLPVAHALKQRGAAPALVVAFLLATPELGIETFALSVRFFGWSYATVRLVAAVAVAIVAALLVARFSTTPELPRRSLPEVFREAEGGGPSRWRVFVTQLDELLHHTLPWTLVGLLAAAYMQAVLPAGAVEHWSPGVDFLVLTLIAVPSYVCAASATPLAAVLMAKGFSPGAVLVGLLLGPATNVATAGWLRQSFGARGAWFGLGGLVLTAWAIGFATNGFGVPVFPRVELHEHEHGWFAMGSLGLLALLALRAMWLSGLRGWLGTLGEALGDHAGHGHGHGHGGHGHGHGGSGHGHAHGHGHGH